MFLLIALALIGFALFYMYSVYPMSSWKRKGVTCEVGWPFIGNFGRSTLQLTSLSDQISVLYNKYLKNERYIGIHQFTKPILMIGDPELIKLIGIKEIEKFRDHNTFSSDDIDPLWSRNLFSTKGERWHALRSTLSPTFTGSKMRAMFSLMEECAKDFVGYFEDNKDNIKEIDVKDTLARFANDVIGTCAFGVQCNSLKDPKNEFFLKGKDATDFSGVKSIKFFGFLVSPTLMKILKVKIFSDTVGNFFRTLIRESIAYRQQKGITRPDVIHLLLEARKNDIHGILSTEDDITAQALIFFFAGFDTVSTSTMYFFYELAINPDAQDKLREEIDEIMNECGGKLTYDALMKMKYLDMTISESLRMWPGNVFVDRVCNTLYVIEPKLPHEKKFTIDPGTLVWFPTYGIMRDERYYPEPNKFIPERFSDENKHKIDPATYLPFGIGPRNCIGSRFALLEMKVLAAMLLHKFEVVPTKKTIIPMVFSRKHFFPFPEGGMYLGFKPRKIV